MTVELKYKLTEQLHADIVLGKDKSFPRAMAINMLLSSGVPNSASLLRKVLGDDAEEPKLRRLAAVGLWRMNTAEAHGYLLEAAKTVKVPMALTAVVKCLGRVGDQNALLQILAVKRSAQGVLLSQASFAASLISHRFGLEGNDLPVPTQYVEMPPSSQQRLEFLAPPKWETDLFTSCLLYDPYGIEISKESLLQFSCPGGRWMVGFNRGIAGPKAIERFQRRKTLMGIVAAKHSEDGRYSPSYLILTAPHAGGGKAYILINRITGEPAWAGSTTSIEADYAKFAIRTVGRIGIVPMELEGTITTNGIVKVTVGSTATRVSEKRHPSPFHLK